MPVLYEFIWINESFLLHKATAWCETQAALQTQRQACKILSKQAVVLGTADGISRLSLFIEIGRVFA